MTILRIYADTSVFGGLHDDEFARPTREMFRQADAGALVLVTSAVVQAELEAAPERVRHEFESRLPRLEIVDVTEGAIALQEAYMQAEVVAERWSNDALHVALATLSGCDAIVSWNFKHLVNMRRIRLYNQVNRSLGHREIPIHSPPEVLPNDDEEGEQGEQGV